MAGLLFAWLIVPRGENVENTISPACCGRCCQ